jgi:hypothetical protein
MHLTRNQAYLHGYRGFKSLSLRHLYAVSSETFVPTMESLPQPDPQRRSGSHKNLDDGLCGWRESPPIWIFGSEYIIKPLDQDQLVAAVLPLSLHWTEVNEPAPLMPS